MSEESLKYFVFASIISADNDEFTEKVKQEIISRFDEQSPDKAAKDAKEVSSEWNKMNWEYILEPIGDKEKIDRLVSILK